MSEDVFKVKSFIGQYSFLSNFYFAPILHQGMMWITAEHAYQAAKTLSIPEKLSISGCRTPGQAKRKGQLVTLRPDFEKQRQHIMYSIVFQKFIHNGDLATLLLETGDAKLIEGNTWNDTYWGVCDGVGKNVLGKILMVVRDEVKDI